jgi:pimeloyl-ACP methyl ester carboxylesterase
MPRVTSKDSTVIAYDKTGRGPAIVLVDGAMAYRAYRGGRPLAAELSKHFTVVTYDRRGRGESGDTPPYAVEREIEDIDALVRELGGKVNLYGFSSGAVLAVRAAAALGDKVMKLAVLEPPFNGDDEPSKQESVKFAQRMAKLLEEGKNSEAVEFFLSDMVPPEVLESMKGTPDWRAMESVAPTLAYENAVMGDGSVPKELAKSIAVPALVLDGGDSPAFKHGAADALAEALPNAKRKTLQGQTTLVPPEVLAPVLKAFFCD